MKITAFAASNSRQSINRQLIMHASEVLVTEITSDAQVDVLDLNDFEMPIYSVDRQMANGIPEAAQIFFDNIGTADGLLISYAEHNSSYSVAFKNVFDWASRIDAKVFQGKPMVVMSASPGSRGGANVLKTAVDSAPYFGADIRASFSVGRFSTVFDSDRNQLIDSDLAATLRRSLSALSASIIDHGLN